MMHMSAIANDLRPASVEELLRRARELGPAVAARWDEAYELRRIPDETIADMVGAGLFKACQPSRVGGYQLPFGTQTSIAIELAEYCGSTGWIASVVGTHHWIVGKFPLAAQQDVWGQTPDALVASAFASVEPVVEPVDGGYRIRGRKVWTSTAQEASKIMLLARTTPRRETKLPSEGLTLF